MQSVERAAAVLRLLAQGSGRLGVGEVSDALGLAKGTAHGLLRTLQGVGLVEQDAESGKYRLGAVLLHLGTRYLEVNELRSRASHLVEALAMQCGESVRIGIPLQGRVLVVHHVGAPDGPGGALDVGALLPLHATALGKVLLGHDATLFAGLRHTELDVLTRATIVSHAALERALRTVRESGWAVEDQESVPAEAGVAAPVRDRNGLVVAAIDISGARDRICNGRGRPDQRLLTYLRDAAGAVSQALGVPAR